MTYTVYSDGLEVGTRANAEAAYGLAVAVWRRGWPESGIRVRDDAGADVTARVMAPLHRMRADALAAASRVAGRQRPLGAPGP